MRVKWLVVFAITVVLYCSVAILIPYLNNPTYTCVGRFISDGYWVVWVKGEQETAWRTDKETWDRIEVDAVTDDPAKLLRFWANNARYPRLPDTGD